MIRLRNVSDCLTERNGLLNRRGLGEMKGPEQNPGPEVDQLVREFLLTDGSRDSSRSAVR